MNESMRLKGRVTVRMWDASKHPTYRAVKQALREGVEPLEEHVTENLVVTAGKDELADWIRGAGYASGFQYCGVGGSTQAPAVGDTDLVTPIGSRKLASDRFRTNNIATVSTFFGSADNNGSWNEAGLFENAAGVPMLARALFSSTITKDASKTITLDWDISVG